MEHIRRILRKQFRRNRTFFSGHIQDPFIRFDYEFYGVGKNIIYPILINLRVYNVYFKIHPMDDWTKFEHSNNNDMSLTHKVNYDIRSCIDTEWSKLFVGLFSLKSSYDIYVGQVKHVNNLK